MADTIAESKLVPEPTTAALSLLALAGLAAAAAVSVSGDRAGDCSLWIFLLIQATQKPLSGSVRAGAFSGIDERSLT